MFVYLNYRNEIRRITDINLIDCSKPRCQHVSEDRIDPALWYKVLVLDSILVDCDTRSVYWNIDRLQEAGYIHKCQENDLKVDMVWSFFKDRDKIFKDGECYDYDPSVDELFDTAVQVFRDLNWENKDKDGNSAAYENLLKMLHVFILPRIKFMKKDRPDVAVVLKWIEKHHEQVEDLVQKKDKTKRNTENSMHEQRKHLLEDGNYSKASYVAACDPEFLTVFLPHLEKFLRKCNEELEEYDHRITPIRNSLTMEEIKLLKILRDERDVLYETVQKAMTAREEIKNVLSRTHVIAKKKKKKAKPAKEGSFQRMYVDISKRLQVINDEIQDLIKTKIKISSVREAVLLTLKEIDCDGYSYGYNCKKGSFQSEMDIFDPSCKPEEWITLREKVTLHLQVKTLGFRGEHEKFCQRVRLQCQQLYDESKLFSMPSSSLEVETGTVSTSRALEDIKTDGGDVNEPLSPDSKFVTMQGQGTRDRRSRNFSFDSQRPVIKNPEVKNGYTSRWSVGSVSKEKCQGICEGLITHIQEMAYRLAIELYPVKGMEPPKCFVNKMYVCYEEHVSSEVMPILNDIYERSYQDHCQGLAAWLQRVPLSEVCGGEMKILNIIQSSDDSGNSSLASSRESSADMDATTVKMPIDGLATIGKRDMHQMSLDELYHIYAEQSKALPDSFTGALEMDIGSLDGDSSVGSDDGVEHDPEINKPDTRTKDSCASGSVAHGDLTTVYTRVSEVVEIEPQGDMCNVQQNGLQPPPYDEVVCRRQNLPPPPAYTTLPPLAEKFYEEFREFERFIQEEDQECTLFGKLRKMTGIIRYIETNVTRLRKESGTNAAVSADDLVDVIIFLLCKLELRLLLKLYAHLNLMIHLSPRFMDGNAHEYSLVTLNVAYQHLFELSVMHSRVEQ